MIPCEAASTCKGGYCRCSRVIVCEIYEQNPSIQANFEVIDSLMEKVRESMALPPHLFVSGPRSLGRLTK